MRRFLLILGILFGLFAVVWFLVIKPRQNSSSREAGDTFFQTFLPISNRPISSETETLPSGTETAPNQPAATEQSPFTQISRGPAAGFTAFTTSTKVTLPATDPKQKPTTRTVFKHVVRYVSRTNGYVYEIVDESIPTQITNTYIPNIYEASFADGGATALLRFLRDDNRTIATYSVPIPGLNADGTRTQGAGTYFPDNISSLGLSPDGTSVARLTHTGNGSLLASGTTKNTGVKEIISSAFNSWVVSWPTASVYLQTKASAFASGYLYRVDAGAKRLVRVLGDIPGLTATVSPKGAYVLYSESVPDGFRTKLLTVKTGKVITLPIATLPEKCTWLKSENLICAGNATATIANYPDDWYSGTLSFSDSLYRIIADGAIVDRIDDGTRSYDAINLRVNEEAGMLYFIDKPTGLLWQFKY